MNILKSIFHFSLSFTLIAIFFELFLSVAGIMNPIVEIDPNKGERYRSNTTCNSLFVDEGFGLARTNSQGWFGKEIRNKGKSNYSVAVIGNSCISARQVFPRNNFISVAENEINSNQGNFDISIYNFGKEAMTLREVLYVKEEVESTIDPDYTVVFINGSTFGKVTRFVPYYELSHDSLSLNVDFKESSFVNLYNRLGFITKSSLLFLGYRVKNFLYLTPEIIFDKFYPREPLAYNPDKKILPIDKMIIKKLAEDRKIVFLLDIDPARLKEIRTLAKASIIIDLKAPLERLKKDQGINPYYWEISNELGHWNNPAHIAIGNELADNLVRIIDGDKN